MTSTAVACDKWCVQYSVSCGTFRGFNLRGGNSVGGESDVQLSQLYHHPTKVIFRSNHWWKSISIRPEPADDDGALWHHSSAAASGRCAVIGVRTAHLTIYTSDPVICSCVDDVLVLCSSSSVALSQWTSVGPSCRRWAHLVEHNMHVLFNPTRRMSDWFVTSMLGSQCWVWCLSPACVEGVCSCWRCFVGGDTRWRWVTARFGWSSFTLISYCLHVPPRLLTLTGSPLAVASPSIFLSKLAFTSSLFSPPSSLSLSLSLRLSPPPRLCHVSESLLLCRGLVSSAEA